MALRVKKPQGRPVAFTEKTPIQKSSECVFSLSWQTYNTERHKDWVPLYEEYQNDWTVNLIESVTFEIGTQWKASGGAAIANKINEMFNSNLIKIIAGENAQSSTPTDEWTQKITEIGQPIPMRLKFRVYHETADEMSTQMLYLSDENGKEHKGDKLTYRDFIRFFTVICAPAEPYTVAKGTLGPLMKAAASAKQAGRKAKDAYDTTSKNGENMVSASLSALHALGEYFTKASGLNGVSNGPRMNYTIMFKKIGSFTIPAEIDWIVKSFTWTPSTPFVMDEKNVPQPLWVDFDVDVETNFAPSNAFVPKMFISNAPTVPAT